MPELDFVPHPELPLGKRESGATGEQKLDMRHFEMQSPPSNRCHLRLAYIT